MFSRTASLSAEQSRMWFQHQLSGGSPAFHAHTVIDLDGPLDPDALRSALLDVAQQNEILRTTFREGDTLPEQCVAERARVPWQLRDLTRAAPHRREERARRSIVDACEAPFDLVRELPWRTLLLRLAPDRHRLLVVMHDIICDGTPSMAALFDELCRALAGDEPSAAPPAYIDYTLAQRADSAEIRDDLEYWRAQLADAPPGLELPSDRPRAAVHTFDGAAVTSSIDGDTLRGLRALAAGDALPALFAAFAVVGARYTGGRDVVVGTPTGGARRDVHARSIGYFGGPVVLRLLVDEELSFAELTALAARTVSEARAHDRAPFERVVEQSGHARDLSRTPFFQALVGVRAERPAPRTIGELVVRRAPAPTTSVPYELMVSLEPVGSGAELHIEYNTQLYDRATIERLEGHLSNVLKSGAASPEARTADIDLLSPEERQRILVEWNDTSRPYDDTLTLPDTFEQRVRETPDAVAVAYEGASLTYAELDRRANQLGHALLERGVGPEVLVGILMDRSLEMVVAILGVQKAGGAYLPLDPAYPAERLAFMVSDSGAKLLVVQPATRERVPPDAPPVFELAADFVSLAHQPSERPHRTTGPRSLAYVIYTSGSTGRPKGVMVEHRGIGNLVAVQVEHFGITPESRILQFASLSFDASLFELVMALCTGATLHLAPQQRLMPGPDLAAFLKEQAITVIVVPPSALANLVAGDYPALRTIVVAGEACSPDLVARWASGHEFFNAYGPTEATVMSSLTLCAPSAGKPDIGPPMANTRAYVLDPRQRPVPVGAAGELYIGSVGLARGYLGRPELTAERFVDDPFGDAPGGKLYRTGDLVRWLPNGHIDFLGRIDHQVKLRGYRIELGEIEAALSEHPAAREVVVIVREDPGVPKQAVAYVVADDPELREDDLRAYLRDRLPPQMVPSRFVCLAAMPLTPNGKVDRRALPAPEMAGPSSSYSPPRNELEEALSEIWSKALARTAGIHDDFFDMGGHSLLAVKMLATVRERFGVTLPMRAVFEGPTIAQLAERVAAQQRIAGAEAPTIEPAAPADAYPLSYAQQRIWFVDSLAPGNDAYDCPEAFRLRGPLDIAALEAALADIVARHASLRTVFAQSEHRPVQKVAPHLELQPERVDLTTVAEAQRFEKAVERVLAFAKWQFDLSMPPLIKVMIVELGDDDHIFAINIHHAVTDGWSMGLLYDELKVAYEARRAGREPELPALPIQYPDYAVWQRNWLDESVVPPQLKYWRDRLGDAPLLLDLPTDRPRTGSQAFRGARRDFQLGRGLSDSLAAIGRRTGGSLFMVLLAGFDVLLQRYTGSDDILIGTPTAGRSREELQHLIGMFANILVLRADLSGHPTFVELVERIRAAAFEAQDHQEVPFEKVVEDLHPSRDLSYNPIVQVAFVPQDMPFEGLSLGDIRVEQLHFDRGIAQFDIVVFTEETADGVRGWVEFSTDLFDPETIERMLAQYETLLSAAAARPETPIAALPLLDDDARRTVLVEWNDTDRDFQRDATLVQLVEQHAASAPNAPAWQLGNESLSYAELNARANQLAALLRGRITGPDSAVGVCLPLSANRIIAILAVLKAGAAYVPLDPEYPQERLSFMIEDASLAVVLTSGSALDWLAGGPELLDPEQLAPRLATLPAENATCPASAESLAYIVYTSGSTGRPKGVCVTHRGVVRLVTDTNHLDVRTDDRVAHVANISFDAAMLELWSALGNGACLVGVPREVSLAPDDFAACIRDAKLTTMFLPAALFHQQAMHAPDCFASVGTLFVGGEALDPKLVREVLRAGKPRRLVNSYGPAECTVAATYHDIESVSELDSSIPIGKPISNTTAYVLDANLRPVPPGVPGELFLGGDGVARGYLNRPELTAERFVKSPFRERPGERLYRTGDRARWRADGVLEFAGRTDFQVKVRGFRVEPGEVEAVLSRHELVREAHVEARQFGPGDTRLLAWVVHEPGKPPNVSALRELVRGSLPDYMVPSAIIPLTELPLTPNMKVDRAALPMPDTGGSGGGKLLSPAQEEIADIWATVLGIERPGPHDNFFDLGGNSLLVTQVVSRMRRKFGVRIKLQQFFESPTVAALADLVDPDGTWGEPDEEEFSIMPTTDMAVLQLTKAQQGFFRLESENPGLPYNVSVAYRLRGPLDVDTLSQCLRELYLRHDVLRAQFKDLGGGEAVQIVFGPPDKPLALRSVEEHPESERLDRALLAAERDAKRPFNIEQSTMRSVLYRLAEDDHLLVVAVHHIVADGWSVGVLLSDLQALYAAGGDVARAELPELRIKFRDIIAWERDWLASDEGGAQLNYWRDALAGAPTVLSLPSDRPRGARQTFRGAIERAELTGDRATALAELIRREASTPAVVVLAAWQIVLAARSGARDLLVGVTTSGRTKKSSEALVGCFLNKLPIRARIAEKATFSTVLGAARDAMLSASDHQEVPFESICEALLPDAPSDRFPLIQVGYAPQEGGWRNLDLPGISAERIELDRGMSPLDLILYFVPGDERAELALEYNSDLFDRSTARSYLGDVVRVIEAAARDSSRPVTALLR